MPSVGLINHNYATFEVERGSGLNTSYTLYDRQPVERIMRDTPDLMPGYKQNSQVARNIAAGRDVAWNKQKIQSSMIQGIMQGESIDKMAKRLQSVTTADYKAAVRYARTMSTSAQNAGRYAAYQRADDMGIDLTLVWTATLDERTRVSHRFLDSEERDVGEPFSVDGVDIYYPGDLGGVDYEIPGYLIWNCRCTIIAQVKGFEYKVHGKDTDYSQIDGEYEDWKNAHESESEDIDAPARRSDDIRADYINQYQNLGNSRNFDSQSQVDSGIMQLSTANMFNSMDFLYDLVKNVPELKDYDDIFIHGSPHGVSYKNADGVETNLPLNKFIEIVKQLDLQKEKIRLCSCSTGATDDGVAKMLANATGKEVMAPTKDLWLSRKRKTDETEMEICAPDPDDPTRPDRSNPGTWRSFWPD